MPTRYNILEFIQARDKTKKKVCPRERNYSHYSSVLVDGDSKGIPVCITYMLTSECLVLWQPLTKKEETCLLGERLPYLLPSARHHRQTSWKGNSLLLKTLECRHLPPFSRSRQSTHRNGKPEQLEPSLPSTIGGFLKNMTESVRSGIQSRRHFFPVKEINSRPYLKKLSTLCQLISF